jgi:hypothetical protein
MGSCWVSCGNVRKLMGAANVPETSIWYVADFVARSVQRVAARAPRYIELERHRRRNSLLFQGNALAWS